MALDLFGSAYCEYDPNEISRIQVNQHNIIMFSGEKGSGTDCDIIQGEFVFTVIH